MATPIKQVPILYGEDAEAFERMAREREQNPQGKPLTAKEEAEIAAMVRQLHEYKPSWKKK
jgi:hypothetical protein